jgi:hypothetical protein
MARHRPPPAAAPPAPRPDDPFWWAPEEAALLSGTRLAAAVRHYECGLDALVAWLGRLEDLRAELAAGGRPAGSSGATGAAAPGASGSGGDAEAEGGGGSSGGGGGGPLSGWGVTRAAALWARSAVWSRAFSVRGMGAAGGCRASTEGAGSAASGEAAEQGATGSGDGCGAPGGRAPPVVCLVPLLDMCDHDPRQRAVWRAVAPAGSSGAGRAAAVGRAGGGGGSSCGGSCGGAEGAAAVDDSGVFEFASFTPFEKVRPRGWRLEKAPGPAVGALLAGPSWWLNCPTLLRMRAALRHARNHAHF